MKATKNYFELKLCKAFHARLTELSNLKQFVYPDTKYWHNSNGQKAGSSKLARIIAGKNDKEMGVMKGLLDYTFVVPVLDLGLCSFSFLEAKVDEETHLMAGGIPQFKKNGDPKIRKIFTELSDEQEEFVAWCNKVGIQTGVFRSVDEGIKILQSWGVLKQFNYN